MPIQNHLSRVAKRRIIITTVDPSQLLIHGVDKTGQGQQVYVNDIPPSFTWPKEGEEWSIYEENGYWRLGYKFLNPDESAVLQSLEPGDSYPVPQDEGVVIHGTPSDGDVPIWNATTREWESGPPPSGSGGDLHYVFSQGTPAATWSITHPLGKYPSVTVVDSAGNTVEGAINYVNINKVMITFVSAFSGIAYLN